MAVPKLRFKADDGSQFPDWEEKKLSDIFVERREMQCIDDEYKLLSFTIEQGVINPEDKKTNKRDFLMKDKASKKFLRTEYNDIIYNPANLKYGAINRNKLGKGLLSPIYAIFYTEQNAVFMESVVRNPDFIKRSLKYLEGTVIKLMTLKPRDFLRIKSYIPSIPEQQKIAEFLSTIDTVIEKQKETVSAWEERKKGVMQKLFSQEVRFKADDGSEFPDWEEKKLGDCCSLITKGTTPKEYPENGDVNFVRIDCIENGSINISKCLKINEQIHNGELARSVLKENDLLCPIAGALGVVTVVTKDILPANTNQALAILRLYESENVQYISKTLSSYIMEKYIRECKTVGAQPNLSLGQMRDLIIPYPCSDEQQKIADCLSSLDEVIEKQKATLAAWEELKKGLLQQMVV